MACILDHFGLSPHDFALHTDWEKHEDRLIDREGKKWRRYESVSADRFHCFFHVISNPLIHGVGVIAMIAYRALRICTLFPLFSESEIPLSLKERFTVLGIETLQVLFSPLLLLALEVTALYGIFQPRDALKLEQSIQILIYNCPLIEVEAILTPLPNVRASSHR